MIRSKCGYSSWQTLLLVTCSAVMCSSTASRGDVGDISSKHKTGKTKTQLSVPVHGDVVRLLRFHRSSDNKKNVSVDEITVNLRDGEHLGKPRPVLPQVHAKNFWISPSHRFALTEEWGKKTSQNSREHLPKVTQLPIKEAKSGKAKVVSVEVSGDFLVSWAPSKEYALFLRNGGEINPKSHLFYIIDPASNTSAFVPIDPKLKPFAAFWSQTGKQLICIAKGNWSKPGKFHPTKESWIFLKLEVGVDARNRIRVAPPQEITVSTLQKALGSSFLPALRASRGSDNAYTSAINISLSPSRRSVLILGDGVNRNVPQWADPDMVVVFYGIGGRVVGREVDSRLANGLTSSPVWSRDERSVYFLTQEYLVSLPVGKNNPRFYSFTEDLEGVFQVAL